MAVRRPRIGARRGMSVLVLAVSCVALLATSQLPDQATLSANSVLAGTVSADAPRVAGTLRIGLSAAALPVGSETIDRVSGQLRISASGVERGRLVLTVTTPTGPVAPLDDPYGATLVPIEQLCPAAEPCDTEVELAVEWLGAGRGMLGEVRLTAVLEVVYSGVKEVPLGATARLEQVAALAPVAAGPALTAQTPDELIVLDRDHWAAARHVRLTASPQALAGETLAFFEQSITRLDSGRVLITVIPDEDRSERLDPSLPFDPFAGCRRSAPCETDFTIRFELSGVDVDMVASVRWSFGARSAFPDDDAVPAGAELTAVMDRAADATLDTPAIHESLSGTLQFVRDSEHDRLQAQGFRLEVEVPPGALPTGAFGGLPPAARAILTVRGDADGYLSTRFESQDERAQDASRRWKAAEGGASVLDNPLRECEIGIGCTRTIIVNIAPQVADDVDGPIEITWQLDVVLAYPALDEVPRLALLELRALPGGG